ncbi:(Lyso)-N-acylphosphatidylethanolamine lipase [Adelges cooleyi]|uniref:(Lyso)-N-acylphosphatidylethanolamine lipase n=1 Tax=Adelges cooleyi TaxID=133065 RepID=UPI0021808689|nr:(Lyso)-N-acylphosphatidylethanolamine lipase [Adelges cooleyi]
MTTNTDTEAPSVYRGSFFWSWFPRSSMSWKFLQEAEQKLLLYVKSPYRTRYVNLGPVVEQEDKIWTLEMNSDKQETPVVLLHGFGAGLALWCMNLDKLSNNRRPVYAMDLLGFGRSSRPQFSSDSIQVEQQYVNAIEKWRSEMKLEKCILLGHSFGGFLATAYTLQYPERVHHLVLADPWGFPEEKKDINKKIPWWVKGIFYVLKPLNPLWPVRFAGPFGQWLVINLRSDILKKFEPVLGEKTTHVGEYIYQCNSQRPTGESAFHSLLTGFGWAKNPMIKRVQNINNNVPITFIYGQDTWMDQSIADIVKKERLNGIVNIEKIPNAGHHVFADQFEAFNDLVNKICQEQQILVKNE